MIRVLFVCTGNICRSPMAEGVFNHLVTEAGLGTHIMSDSAGTTAYHVGEPADPGTVAVLRKHNIPYHGVSRLLTSEDLRRYDYLIALDSSHLMRINALAASTSLPKPPKIARLLDYAPGLGASNVPDPYYSGEFDDVYELVAAGARGLLAAIIEAHGLAGSSLRRVDEE